MKKLILVCAVIGGISLSASAQTEGTPQIEKKPQTEKEVRKPVKKLTSIEKVEVQSKPSEVRKEEVRKEEVKPVQTSAEKPSQRAHAEEKSDGNAFSGKGKGGDKNLKDPVKKEKKEKKEKKAKKEKKEKK